MTASLRIRKLSIPGQFMAGILIVTLISSVCYGMSAYIPYRVVALILLVTVSLMAMFFNIIPVLTAAIVSALFWDYFFIPPHFTFTVDNAEDALMLLMYFIIAMLNGVLTYQIRRIEKESIREEGRANTIKLYNTLLNSLSHELRTPIATIMGASDNLLTEPEKLSEENKAALAGEISKASLRLNQQVENLLNMSRLESGAIKPHKNWCDINELVYAAVNKLENELKNHKVIVNVLDKFPLYKIDFGLMERALYNLINNASLYTPEGSVIIITASDAQHLAGENAVIETVINELVITVADSGKGFPADEVDKVFEKFYRLKNSRTGGTGLGLSIVRGFIEAHSGKIRLENLPEGGAKFTISIPAEISYLNNLKNE